jgi:hypothetical protein
MTATVCATQLGGVVNPASFPAPRERLVAAATAHLFTRTITPTTAPCRLALRSVTVALTEENDLAFAHLIRAPPPPPGRGVLPECADTAAITSAGHSVPRNPALTVLVLALLHLSVPPLRAPARQRHARKPRLHLPRQRLLRRRSRR